MKFCYPANDISSYLLAPVQVKPLSDLVQTSGLGNAIPSKVALEQLEFLEVLACAAPFVYSSAFLPHLVHVQLPALCVVPLVGRWLLAPLPAAAFAAVTA